MFNDGPGISVMPDCLRGRWKIENKLHWVRDVAIGEDLSQVRARPSAAILEFGDFMITATPCLHP